MYKKIVEYDILNFIKIVGEKNVLIDKYSLKQYSHDETEDLSFLPEVVLKPINTDHVSKILSYCNENLMLFIMRFNLINLYIKIISQIFLKSF